MQSVPELASVAVISGSTFFCQASTRVLVPLGNWACIFRFLAGLVQDTAALRLIPNEVPRAYLLFLVEFAAARASGIVVLLQDRTFFGLVSAGISFVKALT